MKGRLILPASEEVHIKLHRCSLFDQQPSSQETGSQKGIEDVADPSSLVTEELWEQEWKEKLMAAAIENVLPRLDPQKAQIFDFNAIRGWNAEKVAALFQIEVHTVHTIKHRVKELIQAEVRRLERADTDCL